MAYPMTSIPFTFIFDLKTRKFCDEDGNVQEHEFLKDFDSSYINQRCLVDRYTFWVCDNKIHREYLPAIEFSNGDKEWLQKGEYYRENGLHTKENMAGQKIWTNKKGKKHRENDLPATIETNGNKYWYKNGKKHRDTLDENNQVLPAIEYGSGTKCWYVNGKYYRENDLHTAESANGNKFWRKTLDDNSHYLSRDEDYYDSLEFNPFDFSKFKPAVQYETSSIRHREAMTSYKNGQKEWWVRGKRIHEKNTQ
jgi:hypothetical protein